MDLQTIEQWALGAMVILGVLLLVIIVINVVRGIWKRPRFSEHPADALRFVMSRSGRVFKRGRDGEQATQEIALRRRALQRARSLDACGVFEHYLSFSQGHAEGLANLSDVLGSLEGETIARYRTFFGVLRAIHRDISEGRRDLPSVRAMREELESTNWQGIEHGLRPLLDFMRRVASLCTRLESWAGFSDAEKEDVREQTKRLAQDIAARKKRDFQRELTVLRDGVESCLSLVRDGLGPAGTAVAARSSGNGIHALKLSAAEVVAVHTDDAPITASFSLRNESDVSLDRIVLRTKLVSGNRPEAGAIVAVEQVVATLRARERESVEIAIPPEVARNGEPLMVAIDVTYHDRSDTFIRYTQEAPVRLVDVRDLTCPYSYQATGVPRHFVGREATLKQIRDLCRDRTFRSCILWGFAGIGKTALLYQIQHACGEKDWRRMRAAISNLQIADFTRESWETTILQDIRKTISQQIELRERPAAHDGRRHEGGGAFVATNEFLDRAQAHLVAEDQVLLLMLDEYQALEDKIGQSPAVQASKRDFLKFLKRVIDNHDRILLILSGLSDVSQVMRESNDMTWLETVGKASTSLNVGYLTRDEALRLIEEPMRRIGFEYEPGVDTQIWEATHGYPVLIQVLCESLYRKVSERVNEGRRERRIDMALWMSTRTEFLTRGADTIFNRLWGAKWVDKIYPLIGVALSKPNFEGRREIDGRGWTSQKRLESLLGATFPDTSAPNLHSRVEDLVERSLVLRMVQGGDIYLRMAVPLMEEWWNRRVDLDTEVLVAKEALNVT